ncbi:hypothetical protein LY78DRAFT_230522 [Colletotrichum sublineola]|nr:hypothetical protein LY78DRAFT_230522 [Colletotrichum sublineola]
MGCPKSRYRLESHKYLARNRMYKPGRRGPASYDVMYIPPLPPFSVPGAQETDLQVYSATQPVRKEIFDSFTSTLRSTRLGTNIVLYIVYTHYHRRSVLSSFSRPSKPHHPDHEMSAAWKGPPALQLARRRRLVRLDLDTTHPTTHVRKRRSF